MYKRLPPFQEIKCLRKGHSDFQEIFRIFKEKPLLKLNLERVYEIYSNGVYNRAGNKVSYITKLGRSLGYTAQTSKAGNRLVWSYRHKGTYATAELVTTMTNTSKSLRSSKRGLIGKVWLHIR